MPTVLLAQANRQLRYTCHWFLAVNGFKVETADDGLACLAKLRRSVPDLLVVGLELPWGGGDGVLEIIRQDRQLLPPHVLVTSVVASAQGPLPEANGSQNFVHVLGTPFRMDLFAQLVNSVIWGPSKNPQSLPTPTDSGNSPRSLVPVEETSRQTTDQGGGHHVSADAADR